jgi:hypothetical protein
MSSKDCFKKGIDYYMDGRLRCYFLIDPIIPDILDIFKKDYREDLPAPACCPVTKRGKYPGIRTSILSCK